MYRTLEAGDDCPTSACLFDNGMIDIASSQPRFRISDDQYSKSKENTYATTQSNIIAADISHLPAQFEPVHAPGGVNSWNWATSFGASHDASIEFTAHHQSAELAQSLEYTQPAADSAVYYNGWHEGLTTVPLSLSEVDPYIQMQDPDASAKFYDTDFAILCSLLADTSDLHKEEVSTCRDSSYSAFECFDESLAMKAEICASQGDPNDPYTGLEKPSPNSVRVHLTRTVGRKSKRLCKYVGCVKYCRSNGLCISHGGGRRCSINTCVKSSQGGNLCIRHGGGKRCIAEGCIKAAQSKLLCKAHGGGPRCQMHDCIKSSQGGGFCRFHGGGKRCGFAGCDKGTQRGSYCALHGGSRLCKRIGCLRSERSGGLCASHGGGRRCYRCDKPCRRRGLCSAHLRELR